MESRSSFRDQPPREGAKQKNVGDGRNRRVLRDIGNLGNAPQNNQINRPTKKPPAAAGKKKESVNPPPPLERSIIVISSDEKTLSRKKANNAGKTGYTSVLTARSKAACGFITKNQKDQILEIDEADADNELAAVEYVEDIYKFYKLTEDDGMVKDYMTAQPEINSKMRSILVDWLIDVHKKFELMPETLFLSVNIIDRFLSMKTVPRKELQLVGISSMLIACKYEEIWPPEVNDFILISDNAYVREQILAMEKEILELLGWYLTVPTPYVFLARYIKAAAAAEEEGDLGKEVENMSFFMAELGLMNYAIIIAYKPSMLAAAAVYAAGWTVKVAADRRWTATLTHHTGYLEEEVSGCAKMLVGLHYGVAENKLKAAYKKFSDPDRGAVALFPPVTALITAAATSSSS